MTRTTSAFVLRSAVVAIAILLASDACSDATRPGGGGGGGGALGEKIRAGTVVSGPLSARDGVSASGPTPDSELVYISMPPGTLDAGDSVRIAPVSRNVSASAPMGAGGFDPVSLYARVGDSLDIAVFTHSVRTTARVGVPPLRRPSVIRTTPARGRTDVPLNQEIVIVFSQPISGASVTSTSIELTLDGVMVPATTSLVAGQPWVVQLTPATSLQASATYSLVVSSTITDVNGSALSAPVNIQFSTGAASGVLASVSVFEFDQYGRSLGSVGLAAIGGKVPFTAFKISAAGDTLTAQSGTPLVWSSSDTQIAKVTPTGADNLSDTVIAVGTGNATISACSGSICGRGGILVSGNDGQVAPTEIGDLGGGDSRVAGMKGGFVVGVSTVPSNSPDHSSGHPFLWSAAHGMEDLVGLPGEFYSVAEFVNDSEVVVGEGLVSVDPNAEATREHWIWMRATGALRLSEPDQAHAPWALFGFNSRGDMAFANDSGTALAFYSLVTGMRVTGAPFQPTSIAAMNDRDQAALITFTPPNAQQIAAGYDAMSICGRRGYIWDALNNSIVATLTPPNLPTGEPLAICASDINNQGVVTGSLIKGFATLSPTDIPFRWSAAGGFTMPSLAQGVSGDGVRLNEAGDATLLLLSYVHVGQDSVLLETGSVWMANGDLIPLGSLGGNSTLASGINDQQLVAGDSQFGSTAGPRHAVIWNLGSGSGSRATAAPPRVALRQHSSHSSVGVGTRHAPTAASQLRAVGPQ